MNRDDLEKLDKSELVEAYLALQDRLKRPSKTSRTSSKPPSTDRKEKRERSKPGGAKPSHKGHSRSLAENPDQTTDHRPGRNAGCGHEFGDDAPGRFRLVSTTRSTSCRLLRSPSAIAGFLVPARAAERARRRRCRRQPRGLRLGRISKHWPSTSSISSMCPIPDYS